MDELLEQRYQRLMAYGVFKEAEPATSTAIVLAKQRGRLAGEGTRRRRLARQSSGIA
jgi:hypothetical protein